jgi:putative ABC transport system substrate-binding protein
MARANRRRFLQGLGGAGLTLLAGCGRLPERGQASARVYRVGYLDFTSGDPASLDAFLRGLQELGYTEGQNLVIEYRSAGGQPERLSDLAAELLRLDIDVILGTSAGPARAAMQLTTTTPIVVANGDPVTVGLAPDLARPSANVTGLSAMAATLNGKRLQLLTDAVPSLTRVAVLAGPAGPGSPLLLRQTDEAARALGLEVRSLEIGDPSEIERRFDPLVAWGAEAIIVVPSAWSASQRAEVAQFATRRQTPSIYPIREFVVAGGLMSYGPRLVDMYHRAAYYVDRILKGATPADLPIEQPMTFDFVINLQTAQAIGLTIPQQVLLQATEVIQ